MKVEDELEKTISTLKEVGERVIKSDLLSIESKIFCINQLRVNIESIGGYYTSTGIPISAPKGNPKHTTSSSNTITCPNCNATYVRKTP